MIATGIAPTALAATALTGTVGIIAIAAGAVAVVAMAWNIALTVRLRRIKRSQSVLLGGSSPTDLVSHAAQMQEEFVAVRDFTADAAADLDARIAGLEQALRGAISHSSLVHYDAYNELSGQQSMSIALLDDTRSGIVLTCIHHREQARVYAKRLRDGRGETELSPEEAEAVRLASGEAVGGEDVVQPAA